LPPVLVSGGEGGGLCPHQPSVYALAWWVIVLTVLLVKLLATTGPPRPTQTHYSLEYEGWKGFVGSPVLLESLGSGHPAPPIFGPDFTRIKRMKRDIPLLSALRNCCNFRLTTDFYHPRSCAIVSTYLLFCKQCFVYRTEQA